MEAADTPNTECKDCKLTLRVMRYKSPSLAIKRPLIFYGPLAGIENKSVITNFKARSQRQGGRNRIQYKVGTTTSSSRILQGLQSIGSMVVPGNPSVIRSPIRSRLYAAATPGGIPGGGGVFVPGREERGYRCPEGYQYGGRFTDSRFSTCGKKLFDLDSPIGRGIGELIGDLTGRITRPEPEVNPVRFGAPPDGVLSTRAPSIPRVGKENRKISDQSIQRVVDEMANVTGSFRRMVRRDGYVVQPVVSAGVLRTVPDNRDMEGATYISSIAQASEIGTDDDMGMLSNTGIKKLTYVLPGGSTISLEKARILAVGERRKLGRTIATLKNVNTDSDPAARLKALAVEMGSGLAYTEDFREIDNPNDIIEVEVPGTRTTRNVRRWFYETLIRKTKRGGLKKGTAKEQESGDSRKISNLQNAIRHINSNGKLSDISPSILYEAIRRSRLYKSRKLKNGLEAYDRPDGQTLIYIPPSNSTYQHIGAAVAADVQRYLDLPTPEVYVAGAPGNRRGYFIQEEVDSVTGSQILKTSSTDTYDNEDLLRLALSDWISDTRDRDISTIVPMTVAGKNRLVSSINRDSGFAGLARSAMDIRRSIQALDFYSEEYLAMIRANFEKRSKAQKMATMKLLEAMIARLRQYELDELYNRLTIDGEYAASEKNHLKIVSSMIQFRINRLNAVKKTFSKFLD